MTRRCLVAWMVAAGAATVALAQEPVVTRVYDTGARRAVGIDAMAEAVASAHVLFVGEQHNDVNTHRVELALLEALASRRGNVVLALEMFERDAQEPLDHFLLDHMTEGEFLAEARPWPEYRRDYKPLVDFAIRKQWPVIAANVPRHIASAVAEKGLGALTERPSSERLFYAADVTCEVGDDYHRRFTASMAAGHAEGTAATMSAEAVGRYYQSQCLKDETMAESIAQAFAAGNLGGTPPLVVVVTGSFHSDYRQGVVARTARRLPDRRVVVATILPVASPERTDLSEESRRRADYVVFSQR